MEGVTPHVTNSPCWCGENVRAHVWNEKQESFLKEGTPIRPEYKGEVMMESSAVHRTYCIRNVPRKEGW